MDLNPQKTACCSDRSKRLELNEYIAETNLILCFSVYRFFADFNGTRVEWIH
jgi:hypothetical protein